VNEQLPFWFHCGHCGSLFKADYQGQSEHVCAECGQNPSDSSIGGNGKPVFSPSTSAAVSAIRNELPMKREGKTIRKQKGMHSINKLIIGWILAMALFAFIGRMVWSNSPEQKQTETVSEAPERKEPSQEIAGFLQEALPKCSDTFGKFLATENAGERAQLSINSEQTGAHMARFNILNPPIKIDPKTLIRTGHGLLKLPVGNAVECQWKSSEGQIIDSVFMEEANQWHLDWDHFARYSDYPWPLFLAGDGPDEGEFRLLARQRFGGGGKNTSSLSIVLYAVAFGNTQEIGSASPEFQVSKDTKNGKLLDAAFALEQSGKRPFGIDLKSIDPEGYIRVRVKIRRVTKNNTRRYELLNVVACHWYSTVESGMEISDQALEK
jgi:hypothetical protein